MILIETLILVLLLGLAVLFISAILAPFESLSWWSGWSGEDTVDKYRKMNGGETTTIPARKIKKKEPKGFIVYLSGIGAISGTELFPEEIEFLTKLEKQNKGYVVVKDIYPYAMNNKGLTSQRTLSKLWNWIQKDRSKKQKDTIASALINIRNMFQVAVSADKRYGPVYNMGLATVIWDGLFRNGYRYGMKCPVYLIGYSGGAQISLGAAEYLSDVIEGNVYLISLGGVFCDDPGIRNTKHIVHFHGTRDTVDRIGEIAFPGRWPYLHYSDWHTALRGGKVTWKTIGTMVHNGPEGYLDKNAKEQDGRSYLDITLEETRAVLNTYN